MIKQSIFLLKLNGVYAVCEYRKFSAKTRHLQAEIEAATTELYFENKNKLDR
jgi:hypothetical protein